MFTTGTYDHPAAVDYILKQTGHSTINYIGHSQGGTFNDSITLIQ